MIDFDRFINFFCRNQQFRSQKAQIYLNVSNQKVFDKNFKFWGRYIGRWILKSMDTYFLTPVQTNSENFQSRFKEFSNYRNQSFILYVCYIKVKNIDKNRGFLVLECSLVNNEQSCRYLFVNFQKRKSGQILLCHCGIELLLQISKQNFFLEMLYLKNIG